MMRKLNFSITINQIQIQIHLLAALAASCLLGGCAATLGEPYQRPSVTMPPAWIGKGNAPPAAANPAAAWPDRAWWRQFQSAGLDRLIALAQDGNGDLQAASARVRQARASVRIAAANLYPSLTVGASAERAKARGAGAATTLSISPQASYAVDLWGSGRFSREAAAAALQSSIYAQEALRLTIIADVANTYFQMLSLSDRILVARDNIRNTSQLLELVEAQGRAGKVSGLELEQQRTVLANASAALPPLLQQSQVMADAMAVLLGRHPGQFHLALASLRTLAVPAIALGLPSDLLTRRPDIRRAEADLIAANANLNAARAALFPQVSLGVQGSLASATVAGLFNGGTASYGAGLSLLSSIFDGGNRQGQIDLSRARQDELVAAYRQAIVSGVREVEDALAGIEQFEAQEKLLQEATRHAEEAYRIAEIQYRLGRTDFSHALDAQRTLLSAQAAQDGPRLARFTAAVELFLAAGGGW